jgi:carbon-monoxide dehydrogenase small subunit
VIELVALTAERPDPSFVGSPQREVKAKNTVKQQLRETAPLSLRVNGRRVELAVRPHRTLLEVLREDLGLTGTKHGCELGECGTCTVLLDGRPVLSCLVLALACQDREVVTIEGMADGPNLHPLQESFAQLGAAQCGYCTPGFLLTAKALLDDKPSPTRDEIKEALAGNLCRCTGYIKIYEAVEQAAPGRGKRTSRKTEVRGKPRKRARRA